MLRTPSPAVPDDDGEQLGLAVPLFQDSPLSPVVFRRLRPKLPSSVTRPGKTPTQYELLVSVTAVNALAGTCGYESADSLFAAAYGVLLPETDLPGVLLEIQSASWSEVGGAPYLYRLLLRAPLALNT